VLAFCRDFQNTSCCTIPMAHFWTVYLASIRVVKVLSNVDDFQDFFDETGSFLNEI